MKKLYFVLLLIFLINSTIKSAVFTTVMSGQWNDPVTWDLTSVPSPSDTAIISSGYNITSSVGLVITNLNINSGATLSVSAGTVLISGDLVVNGTFQAWTNVTMNGANAIIDGTGTCDFTNSYLYLSNGIKTIQASATLIVYADSVLIGSETIIYNNGYFVLGNPGIRTTDLVAQDNTSMWINEAYSSLHVAGKIFDGKGILDASANYNGVAYEQMQVEDTFNICIPSSNIYSNLIISTDGGKRIIPTNITINENLFIYYGELEALSSIQIQIQGDWYCGGGAFVANYSDVLFNGTADQQITIESYQPFNKLTVQKAGGDIWLYSDIYIKTYGMLDFVSGNVYTNSYAVLFESDAYSVHSSTGQIIGRLGININSSGLYYFDIGSSTSYNEAQVNIQGSFTSGYLFGEFVTLDPGNTGVPLSETGMEIYDVYTEGYWRFYSDGAFSTDSFSIRLKADGFTSLGMVDDKTRILRRDGSADWSLMGEHGTFVPTDMVVRNSITTTIGDSISPTELGIGAAQCQPILASTIVTDILCFGETTGTIDLTVTSGTSPFNYSWSNGFVSEDISSLSGGTYTVTVTDSNGCQGIFFDVVNTPASPLALGYSPFNIACWGDSTGQIFLNPNGGTAPYSFLWFDGDTNQNRNNLVAGNYNVTVTDANGCTAVNSIALTQPTAPLSLSGYSTSPLCYGGTDGSASILALDGTSPYTYLWSNTETTDTITNVGAGLYEVIVNDANLCADTFTINITEPAQLIVSKTITDVPCTGQASGSIVTSPSGGTGGLNYLWSNGSTFPAVSGLIAGQYILTITDIVGCTLIDTTIITEPDSVLSFTFNSTHLSCFGDTTGSIDISPLGGTPPYNYLWNNGDTIQDAINLAGGIYSVTVYDSNNCFSSQMTNIIEPSEISFFVVNNFAASCSGDCDGSAFISASGGMPTYSYLWSTGESSSTANQLCVGLNSLTVTDSYGCEASYDITIAQSPYSSINGIVQYSGGVFNDSEVEVFLYKNNFTGNDGFDLISSQVNSAGGVFQFSDLEDGEYYVKAKVVDNVTYSYIFPTYFNNIRLWENAIPLVISCDSIADITIDMFEIAPPPVGIGEISGQIVYAALNKAILGEPVPGAEVTLEQEPDDDPIANIETDIVGGFSFKDIPNASYTLKVDIPGMPQISTYHVNITDEDTLVSNLVFYVDTTEIDGSIYTDELLENLTFESNEFSCVVYPNPSADIIHIEYEIFDNAEVLIEMFDVSGKKLKTIISDNIQNVGEYCITIHSKELNVNTGMYFIKLQIDNSVYIKRIALIK